MSHSININAINPEFVENKLREMFENDITTSVKWKTRWKTVGNWCVILSKFSMGISIISEFIAGFYNIRSMSFVAGCSSTCAIILLSYSTYSFNESAHKNNELDNLLKRLKIHVAGIHHEELKHTSDLDNRVSNPISPIKNDSTDISTSEKDKKIDNVRIHIPNTISSK